MSKTSQKASLFVKRYKERSLQIQAAIPEKAVADLIELLDEARREERQTFFCGNGGSAAMASHMASELGKEASWGRRKRFRVIPLTDNVPWITSTANDSSYADVFVEQLKNFGRRRDVLIAFSTSGNSPNVLRAVDYANSIGMVSVGIVGSPGGKLAGSAQRLVQVDSAHTGHIQDGHFLIQHLVCYYFIEG